VPFCRAANSALAMIPCWRLYLAMDRQKTLERLRRLGAQRRTREIMLAVVLTIAAFAFLASAILGSDTALDGTQSVENDPRHYETAGKAPPQ